MMAFLRNLTVASIMMSLAIAPISATAQSAPDAEQPSVTKGLSLLRDAELIALVVRGEQTLSDWLGLAGLNKLEHPPERPEELITYRNNWRQKDPAIAPFLGFWHDADYSDNRYYLSIFPSAIDDHVCVVEFKPKFSVNFGGEEFEPDVISGGIFSVSLAKATAAQLSGQKIKADELAINSKTLNFPEEYQAEFLPFYDSQGYVRVVAAANVPQLPPDLPTEFLETAQEFLTENRCF